MSFHYLKQTIIFLILCLLCPDFSIATQQDHSYYHSQRKKEVPESTSYLELISKKDQVYLLLSKKGLQQDILVVSRLRQTLDGLPRHGLIEGGYQGTIMNELLIRFTLLNDTIVSMNALDRVATIDKEGALPSTSINLKFDNYSNDKILINISPIVSKTNDFILLSTIRKNILSIPAENVGISVIKTIADSINLEIISEIDFRKCIIKLSTSFLLLPQLPQKGQPADPRIGFFSQRTVMNKKNKWSLTNQTVIKRWNIAPKNKNIPAISPGDPQKPIIFYIDTSVPQNLVPYFIKGVNAWNEVFEKIGFQNTISARLYSSNDTLFSPFDIRHSIIHYLNSTTKDATYQTITDPRSGEIIQSHILWSSNMLTKVKQWYYTYLSLDDSATTNFSFSDSLIGNMFTYVISHEVGHCLGLDHNFQGSAFASIENLRDPQWVELNGISSSIMDYCRINYIMQPEDGVLDGSQLIGKIGQYDYWAIKWGYGSYIPENKLFKRKKLQQLIKQKAGDVAFKYGGVTESNDPRNQMEDISNNSIEAVAYGLKGLNRRIKNFNEKIDSIEDKQLAKEMYQALYTRYLLYCNHVSQNIAGIYMDWKNSLKPKQVFHVVPDSIQKRSIDFVAVNFLTNLPKELFDSGTLSKLQLDKATILDKIYSALLEKYFTEQRILQLQSIKPSDSGIDLLHYYLRSIRLSIFSDLYAFDVNKEDKFIIQMKYIEKLNQIIKANTSLSDVMRNERLLLKDQIKNYMENKKKAGSPQIKKLLENVSN